MGTTQLSDKSTEQRLRSLRIVFMRYVLCLAALTFTGCFHGNFGPSDRFEADFHYTFDLQPGGRINVEGFNGSIEIAGWDENRVDVHGVKAASTEEMRDQIRIEQHNTPTSIDLRAVRPSSPFGNTSARYVIRVPRTAVLDRIATSNGSIRVRDVASAIHLTTSNSSIRAENIPGDLNARTSNGSIEIDEVRGALVLKTSNSHIHAVNIEGSCDANTSNGSVDLAFQKTPKHDVTAHTNNSGITLRLPEGTDARLDAETSNASVTSDFEFVGSMDEHKRRAEGVIGKGGPMLRLSTNNGHIRIVKGDAE